MWWLSAAWAWTPDELRPVELGGAFAASAAWDGGPAWFVGDARGLWVLDPVDGHEIGRSEVLHPRDLVVAQLDGVGDPEVLACGPEGISLVRGSRAGLALPRPLSDQPCDALVAYDHGDYPALASLGGGHLSWWNPTSHGLEHEDGPEVGAEALLAASGSRVAVTQADGELQLYAPEEERDGPVTALAAGLDDPPGFVWLTGGERPALHVTGRHFVPLDEPVTGVVSDGRRVMLLDDAGHRIRSSSSAGWTSVPVAPRRAAVIELDDDGCTDLVLWDAEGHGAIVRGGCADEVDAGPTAPEGAPTEAPPSYPDVAIRPTPAEIVLGGTWPVVDARVGTPFESRVTFGDGKIRRWKVEGGPPGFSIASDGTIAFAFRDEDVGRWRVSVQAARGLGPRWAGFELAVWPRDTAVSAEPEAVGVIEHPATAGDTEERPLLPGTTLWFGLGAAGALAENDGTTWEHLGEAATRGGVSPMGSIGLELGDDRARAWVAVDSAPFVTYASSPNDGLHVFAGSIGAQFGWPRTQIGPYATVGWSLGGVGLRGVTRPFETARGRQSGLEIRALWLAPQIGGELTACWLWQL